MSKVSIFIEILECKFLEQQIIKERNWEILLQKDVPEKYKKTSFDCPCRFKRNHSYKKLFLQNITIFNFMFILIYELNVLNLCEWGDYLLKNDKLLDPENISHKKSN